MFSELPAFRAHLPKSGTDFGAPSIELFLSPVLGRALGRSWEGRFQLARGTRMGAPALAGEGRWLCCSSPPWDQMAQRWILSPSRLCGVPPEPPALSSGLPWLRWHFLVASMATKSPKHSVLAGPSVFTQKDPSLPPITGFPTLGLTLEISSPGGPEPRSCPRQPSATDVPAFPATSRAPGPSGCAEPAPPRAPASQSFQWGPWDGAGPSARGRVLACGEPDGERAGACAPPGLVTDSAPERHAVFTCHKNVSFRFFPTV